MERLCQSALAFLLFAGASALAQQPQAVQPISSAAGTKMVDPKGDTEEKAKPKIAATEFGSITIGGTVYTHDILIRLDGAVEKRKKKLSKRDAGTSHIISLDEAKHVYQEGAVRLIVGTGQYGMVKLSEAAVEYFKQKACAVELLPTPAAMQAWNKANGPVIGLFHVTC